jgi:hypothetical protein
VTRIGDPGLNDLGAYGEGVRDERVRLLTESVATGDNRVGRLCAMAVDTLAVGGAGLSVSDGAGQQRKLAATDEVSDRIEDLQVLLGQGPCVDAVSTGAPVLVADLDGPDVASRWPMFTPAASALGVRATFSVPLLVGDLRLGAMDLYRGSVGHLVSQQVEEAEDFASAAVNVLLEMQAVTPGGSAASGMTGVGSSAVHQATGMVMVQLDADAEAAFAALRARAYQEGRTLLEVARDVLERRLRLSDGE